MVKDSVAEGMDFSVRTSRSPQGESKPGQPVHRPSTSIKPSISLRRFDSIPTCPKPIAAKVSSAAENNSGQLDTVRTFLPRRRGGVDIKRLVMAA